MKKSAGIKGLIAGLLILFFASVDAVAQTCEWRLMDANYSGTDPDGAGPALGSVTFKLQIHTTAGSIPNVNVLATGFSYQSANAMIPTTPGCAIVSNPANVTVSPAFTGGGFTYTTVNQCGNFSQVAGPQSFDRRAVGTLDGTGITLTTAWVDVFTVTLWTLNNTAPYGGYATINSGSGGSPGEFTTYSVSDDLANEYPVNSVNYNLPLLLGPIVTPVLLTDYKVNCSDNGALISWTTASEINSDYFSIEKNSTGSWITLGKVPAAGNSADSHNYQYADPEAGAAQYRVKQVDKDGRFIYTEIRQANCHGKAVTVVIYPVPAHDVLNVRIRTEKAIRTELQVIGMSGRVARKQVAVLNAGINNVVISTVGLAPGEYVIRSSDGTVNLSRPFTIVR
ncbi:MAG: hypothetical protein HZA79_02660 [Sphingobacteriales bacterium]|nr:hypothetical protein [Sphingobacteriales bacterium]